MSIKSFGYEELKDIIFIDTDSTMEFNYINNKPTSEPPLKKEKITNFASNLFTISKRFHC